MIDVNAEDLMTLTKVTQEVPCRPSLSTIWRWHARGVNGIRLETIILGGRRYTSREALQRFAERTTALADGEPEADSTAELTDQDTKEVTIA